jgi:hypothetical protein
LLLVHVVLNLLIHLAVPTQDLHDRDIQIRQSIQVQVSMAAHQCGEIQTARID